MKKNNNGVTLIALVITIIVLLILAGVSIAMLTGDNGILKKATDTKEINAQKTAEEKVNIEVLGSYGLDGNIDFDLLNSNLQNLEGLTFNNNAISNTNKINKLPAVVMLDGYEITITRKNK